MRYPHTERCSIYRRPTLRKSVDLENNENSLGILLSKLFCHTMMFRKSLTFCLASFQKKSHHFFGLNPKAKLKKVNCLKDQVCMLLLWAGVDIIPNLKNGEGNKNFYTKYNLLFCLKSHHDILLITTVLSFQIDVYCYDL